MEEKVRSLLARFDEVEQELGRPDVVSDQKRYRGLTQEHSYLSRVKNAWEDLSGAQKTLKENRELLKEESDFELQEMIREEIAQLESDEPRLLEWMEQLLVPPDPDDHRNTIVEIRAGTGGDEAALFVGDCIRMYKLYAEQMGWTYEPLGGTPSDLGGYKEYIMVLSGENVHRNLQYEGGIHRVQRVPETETQGRIHTSAVTVAILLEPDEREAFHLDEKDLRIETTRASGAGGQHVNTTDSAVKIIHLPTGITSGCQDERSQHKNKDKALRLLAAKVAQMEKEKRDAEVASKRAEQVGSGDRSERIRTYNFPQNRITDHRINLTKHNLDQVMNGALNEIIQPLVLHFHQQKLTS